MKNNIDNFIYVETPQSAEIHKENWSFWRREKKKQQQQRRSIGKSLFHLRQ